MSHQQSIGFGQKQANGADEGWAEVKHALSAGFSFYNKTYFLCYSYSDILQVRSEKNHEYKQT